MGGYVYVLANPSMPGVVKVGMTTRDPQQRARELSGTGVPTPFKVEVAYWTSAPDRAERVAHQLLADERLSQGREFFRCSAADADIAVQRAIRQIGDVAREPSRATATVDPFAPGAIGALLKSSSATTGAVLLAIAIALARLLWGSLKVAAVVSIAVGAVLIGVLSDMARQDRRRSRSRRW